VNVNGRDAAVRQEFAQAVAESRERVERALGAFFSQAEMAARATNAPEAIAAGIDLAHDTREMDIVVQTARREIEQALATLMADTFTAAARGTKLRADLHRHPADGSPWVRLSVEDMPAGRPGPKRRSAA